MVLVPDILDPTRKIRSLFHIFRRGSKLHSVNSHNSTTNVNANQPQLNSYPAASTPTPVHAHTHPTLSPIVTVFDPPYTSSEKAARVYCDSPLESDLSSFSFKRDVDSQAHPNPSPIEIRHPAMFRCVPSEVPSETTSTGTSITRTSKPASKSTTDLDIVTSTGSSMFGFPLYASVSQSQSQLLLSQPQSQSYSQSRSSRDIDSSRRPSSTTRTATTGSGSDNSARTIKAKQSQAVGGHVNEPQRLVEPQLVRDTEYYCDPSVPNDENCCVLRVEDTLFKVHKIVLCRDNSSFSKKLWFSHSNGSEGLNDSNPVTLLHENVDKFRDLLWVLHTLPPDFHLLPDHENFSGDTKILQNRRESLPLSRLLNVTEMAQKYRYPSFEIWSVQQIYRMVREKSFPHTISSASGANGESVQRTISTSSSITLISDDSLEPETQPRVSTEDGTSSITLDNTRDTHPDSNLEDNTIWERIIRIALRGSHTALLELICRKLLTKTLWFNYTPSQSLLCFLERNASKHKSINTLLGVAYYRLLIDLPQIERAECDHIRVPVTLPPFVEEADKKSSRRLRHSHATTHSSSTSTSQQSASSGHSRPSHDGRHHQIHLKQPFFSPAIDTEHRMKFLAAHTSLTRLWEELVHNPPQVPGLWQKSSKLRKRSKSTATMRSTSSMSNVSVFSLKKNSPHSDCADTWRKLWHIACLEAQEVRRRGPSSRLRTGLKPGLKDEKRVESTQNQSTADVLGLLKCAMLRLRRSTAREEGICLDCSLAGLERMDALRDEIIEDLVHMFRYTVV